MDSPIPTALLQQLWRVLTQLLWLQPEQERPLLKYRKAIRKADEKPSNPGDQTELFNRADIMQHMENRSEIAAQLHGMLQELAKEPFYAKLVLTFESMTERPELSFDTKVPGQPYIKEIQAICDRYVDSRPQDGEYKMQKAKAEWRMAEIRRIEAEDWKGWSRL